MIRKKWKDLKKGDKLYVVRKNKKTKLFKISTIGVKKVSSYPCYGDEYLEIKFGRGRRTIIAKKEHTNFKYAFTKEFFFTTKDEAIDALDEVLREYKEELEEKVNELINLIVEIDNFRETI